MNDNLLILEQTAHKLDIDSADSIYNALDRVHNPRKLVVTNIQKMEGDPTHPESMVMTSIYKFNYTIPKNTLIDCSFIAQAYMNGEKIMDESYDTFATRLNNGALKLSGGNIEDLFGQDPLYLKKVNGEWGVVQEP